MKQVIFAVVLLGALALFAWTVRRFARMLFAGRPEPRIADRTGDRLRSILIYFFGQKKVIEKTKLPAPRAQRFVSAMGSKYHFLIFWGFIIITIGTGETLIQGLFPSFSLATILGDALGEAIYIAIDVCNLLVLLTIGFAFFRRIVLQPRLIPMSRDAAAILGAIAGLMITHFGIHAFAVAEIGSAEPGYPVSSALGEALAAVPPGVAGVLSEASWWLHVVLVLAFLNYLLYSKHSHIIAALPNIYFRKLGQRGVLPKLNMEADDMAATGVVSECKDFTWKSLLDGFACTECARCTNFCPAYNTGKPLSPMQVIHDVRDDMKTRMPDRGPLDHLIDRFQHGEVEAKETDQVMPLIGGRTTEDVLWACTTCGACQEVCPVFIEHPEKIIQMRQNLVLVQEKVPPDLARTFTNLERNGNPWGIGADKRMDWAEGKDVPTLDDKPDAEYLLWVGCAGAYDDRIKKQTLALVDILREGGVDFAVLGLEEGCTGRSGAAIGQRDAVPDAGAAERRDHERQEGEEGHHRLPALPAHDQERVPAAGRQLRGAPPHPGHPRAGRRRQDRDRQAEDQRQERGLPRPLLPRPLERRVRRPRATCSTPCPPARPAASSCRATRSTASAAAPAAAACGWRKRSARA